MKSFIQTRQAWVIAIGAAAAIIGAGVIAAAAADSDGKREDSGFLEKMGKWEEAMTEKFRDTWNALQPQNPDKTASMASIDVREENNRYVVRLSLPNRDLGKVEILAEDGALRIDAPGQGKATRYQQTVELEGVVQNEPLNIDRRQKDSMIVVTVPKHSGAEARAGGRHFPAPLASPQDDWDKQIFAQMDRMRHEMDRAFQDAFSEFKGSADHGGFFDEDRLGSSVDLKDEGNKYVVRAYLPDRNMPHVNVTLEGETLKIEAKDQREEDKENSGSAQFRSSRQSVYEQEFTLPGPVQDDKMKVEQKDGMVIVTLPKKR